MGRGTGEPGMSLARLTALGLIALALALLVAAVVADRLVTARLAAVRGRLQALAWEESAARALEAGRTETWEARRRALLPGAVRLRLLPAGAREGAAGPFPGLGFADLALLREAAEGAAPPAEAHLWGTPEAHVDLVEPVPGPREGDPPRGFVLASFPPRFLEGALGPLAGRLELRQPVGGRALVLAAWGEPPARGVGPFGAAVAGSRWELRYQPPAPAGGWRLWAVFGALFLALAALGLGLARVLARALRTDLQALIGLMRELQAGRSPEEVRARLREVQGALDVLASLSPAVVAPSREGGEEAVPPEPPGGPAPSGVGRGPLEGLLEGATQGRPGSVRQEERPETMIEGEATKGAAGGAGGTAVPASIFRAYDVRGVVGETLTPALVERLGQAIGTEALARGQQSVVVGRDGRLSSPELAEALIRGLLASGREVVDIGLVPTPVLYFATHYLTASSGVMVTGSHNPPQYNGFKIVLRGETLAQEEIQALRRRMESGDLARGEGSLRRQEVLADYVQTIVDDVRLARPLRVVVDCGNGAAGEAAPRLLRALGCEVEELHCEIDGRFPNHHPDPSQPENLRDLVQALRRGGADLGLAFDGDGDRLALLDERGEVVWPDRQMMLFARDVLSRHPGATILFDVKCSRHLAEEIRRLGGQPLMWRTGHSLIKRKMRETGALLAGEMSGHIFFKERWFGFDDALYSAARLLEILAAEARPVSQVVGELPAGVSTPELRLEVPEGRQQEIVARLVEAARRGRHLEGAVLTTLDGLRADFEDGWGLVRASNTTPCLILRFEGDDERALARIQKAFRRLLEEAAPGLEPPF